MSVFNYIKLERGKSIKKCPLFEVCCKKNAHCFNEKKAVCKFMISIFIYHTLNDAN